MSFLSPALSFFSIGPTRNFAGISGYVTISESTTDSLEITQQPVQQGASIADHAFKKPVLLSIQIQFANGSGSFLDNVGVGGIGSIVGIGMSLKQVYQKLLELQVPKPPAILTPFDVSTLKRTYKNMLLQSLGCTTDKRTENVLSISCTFQECIIVPIGITNIDPSLLKAPEVNRATAKAGNKSAALSITQGLGFNVKGVTR